MQKQPPQISALMEALDAAGFSPRADMDNRCIFLDSLPEFQEPPVFALTIRMDAPQSTQWDNLFDGCVLESGPMAKGAPHKAGIYSRRKAVERARQEKWVATWSLFDAGILPAQPRPSCERWQDVELP